MKTILSIIKKAIAAIFLLAVMYLVICDGMMTYFDLSRGIQYAYNLGALMLLLPLGLYFFLGLDAESGI